MTLLISRPPSPGLCVCVWDLREVPYLCVCHRNNPEECLWRVSHRCGLLLPRWACLHGCMNRQADTSRSCWQQTPLFFWSSNKNTVLVHWGRDLCDTRSGAHGGCSFLQYLDNCECKDIISPACCAFWLEISKGIKKKWRGWRSAACFCC